ncbi:TetR/AcrR family transcriptional regulator [Chryseobacterium phocaeense]|uniref:TetR/AcrR family transcriptional regulator n=1 Tax=Chryseobacterium phocaeense TaxID=1816690 RepID=UPI0009BC5CE0|nr:TetR family transcriptional regulator [Chryseobacterium phocaeense]
MAKAKDSGKKDFSTEEKIKEAARIVFYRKGFAATRTRDIAEEAEINLALLNYYFRSKQKLFEIIMIETLSGFVRNMITVLNDEKTNLDDKVSEIATRYIDLITEEPEIPTFIVSEIRSNPALLLNKLPIREVLMNSVFFKQHQQAVAEGKIKEPNPLHFLMNLMGLIVFPFIAKPLLMGASETNATAFNEMMEKRKTLVPVWIKAMMQAE